MTSHAETYKVIYGNFSGRTTGSSCCSSCSVLNAEKDFLFSTYCQITRGSDFNHVTEFC